MQNNNNNSPKVTATKNEGPIKRQVVGIKATKNAASKPYFRSERCPTLYARRLRKTPSIAGMKTNKVSIDVFDSHFNDAAVRWKPTSGLATTPDPV